MPQLVKGGKYVFGWCVIGVDGAIMIPEEARREYLLESGERVILMPGSRTSGGFSIARKSKIEQSKFSEILLRAPEPAQFEIKEGRIVHIGKRALCWLTIRDKGCLPLPPGALEAYGVKPGDHLLAIRGSNVGVGMIVKGPIIEEALKHPEIEVFRVENEEG